MIACIQPIYKMLKQNLDECSTHLQVYKYFVAAGMHSRGIQAAGGVGRLMAELIIDDGAPFTNLWQCDIQRFVPHHSNRKFLRDRVKETIGE